MDEKKTINCPYCTQQLEVERSWDGCKAECPYCGEKFIISLARHSVSSSLNLNESQKKFVIQNGGRVILYGGKAYVNVANPNSLKVMSKVLEATRFGLEFLDSWDHHSGRVATLEKQGEVWEYRNLRWVLVGKPKRGDATQVALERALVDLNARIDAAVLSFRWPAIFGFVECPFFTCNRGERLLWWGKAYYDRDENSVINPADYRRAGEFDGCLFITNERVCFASAVHRQEYKISSLRTVKSNWHDFCGSLIVGSSSRKQEKYMADEIWKPALILQILWNEFVRMKFISCPLESVSQDVCESLCSIVSFKGRPGAGVDDNAPEELELKWTRCGG